MFSKFAGIGRHSSVTTTVITAVRLAQHYSSSSLTRHSYTTTTTRFFKVTTLFTLGSVCFPTFCQGSTSVEKSPSTPVPDTIPSNTTSSGSEHAATADATVTAEEWAAQGEDPLDCPCLAAMKNGTCGPQFIAAYRCFLDSKVEEKGSDCIELFRAMQSCMMENEAEYSDFLRLDDDDDDDVDDDDDDDTIVTTVDIVSDKAASSAPPN